MTATKRVWKYPIPLTDVFEISMPRGAEILYVTVQAGVPNFWALVDPSAPLEGRVFLIVGTGHEVRAGGTDDVGPYVGSWQQGPLVWHLFELFLSGDEAEVD